MKDLSHPPYRGGQQVKLPALFQVANLPDSMLNGRSNEWLEEAMQKIEKQLVEMILDGKSSQATAAGSTSTQTLQDAI